MRVASGDTVREVRLAAASHEAGTLGPADLVLIALKAPALADAAPSQRPLKGPPPKDVPRMTGGPGWLMA